MTSSGKEAESSVCSRQPALDLSSFPRSRAWAISSRQKTPRAEVSAQRRDLLWFNFASLSNTNKKGQDSFKNVTPAQGLCSPFRGPSSEGQSEAFKTFGPRCAVLAECVCVRVCASPSWGCRFVRSPAAAGQGAAHSWLPARRALALERLTPPPPPLYARPRFHE